MRGDRRSLAWLALVVVIAGQHGLAAELEHVSLTVLVNGLLPESDEPFKVRRATVRVENSDVQTERLTDKKSYFVKS